MCRGRVRASIAMRADPTHSAVLPPARAEPAPPARRLLPFRGRAHEHVAKQAVGPYPDDWGARAPGDGCEPQLTVAQEVEPGEFDLHALRYVDGQGAEQRDS